MPIVVPWVNLTLFNETVSWWRGCGCSGGCITSGFGIGESRKTKPVGDEEKEASSLIVIKSR